MRNFKSVRFAGSKEILNGVVMYKAAKPKSYDLKYTVLVRGKRLNNTSDKSVVSIGVVMSKSCSQLSTA
jgi:hypothetical protein